MNPDSTTDGIFRARTVLCLLVLAVVVTYSGGILTGGFHFDDLHHVQDNPGVRSLGNLPLFFTDATLWSGVPGNIMYRPMGMVFHALDYAVWDALVGNGYHGPGWVLTNALLHAVVSFLVFALAVRLGLSRVAAFLAAMVMALHPVHSEVVSYVSARSESTAALFVLLAFLAHWKARSAQAGGTRLVFVGLAVVLSFLGLACKETAATFCVAVGWMELVLADGPWGARFRTALRRSLVYLVPLAVYMLLRWVMIGHAAAPVLLSGWEGLDAQVGGQRTFFANLATQSRAGVLYLQLLVRPVRLAADHDVGPFNESLPAVAASVLVHAAVLGFAVRALFRGGRLIPLTIGWAYIFVLPSTLIALNVVMNEHRMYLPGIALALLAGACLARVLRLLSAERSPGFARLVIAGPLVLFSVLAADRSREWGDDLTLWTTAVERSPRSARAHQHVGATIHLMAKSMPDADAVEALDMALASYARADELHPRWYDLQLSLGDAWLMRGRLTAEQADFARSLAAYEMAGEIVGTDRPRPRYFQAAALTELGRTDDAVAILTALDDEDDSVTTVYDDAIARALRRSGDRAGAARHMQRVIDIEAPLGRVDGLLTLGWWHFEDGDLQRSQEVLSQALEIGKEQRLFRPFLYIARFLNVMGSPEQALEYVESARELGWRALPREVRWVEGGPTPGRATELK